MSDLGWGGAHLQSYGGDEQNMAGVVGSIRPSLDALVWAL